MGMQVYTGLSDTHTFLEKLVEVGALTRFEKETDELICRAYLNDNVYFRTGKPAADTTGSVWMDICVNDPQVVDPIFAADKNTVANQKFNWKIIKFDTGYLFGISTYNGTGNEPYLNYFIGNCIDDTGKESKGAICRLKTSSDYVIVTGEVSSITIKNDVRTIGSFKSEYSTVLIPVYHAFSRKRFRDIYIVSQSTTTDASRHFILNNEHYYAGYSGDVAIKFAMN